MCGIVGFSGTRSAIPILIQGLKNLEYRGYDSAGIAILENNKIKVFKEKGRIKNVEEKLDFTKITSSMGIAHTRWSTHGKPSKENAHPHMSEDEKFAVVHNGIIENYSELKEFLIAKGYHFKSETDTEVIPNLISYYYERDKDVFLAFRHAISELKGSYAILLISTYLENTILVAKMGSPLVIGVGKNENYIASDIPAIVEYTKDFYYMLDGEVAVVNETIQFYNQEGKAISKELKVIDWDKNAVDKNGYEDFMLKEIFEQPRAIKETIAGRINLKEPIQFLDLNLTKEYIESLNKIYIVACGTAMHAGKSGKMIIEQLTNIPVIVDVASEFRYQHPIIDKNTLCIFISQSGETADTIAALKLAKSMGAKTIAISNVVGSSITREAHHVLYTHAGPEIAVASTKAYVSQVALISTFALYLGDVLGNKDTYPLKEDLLSIPEKIEEVLSNINYYKEIAHKIYNEHDLYYIGRGNDYNIALEGSLKLKEISYIHSEAYPAGELKHGPIALIEENTTVVGIMTDDDTREKTLSNLEEVKARGAKLIIISNDDVSLPVDFIKIPKTHPLLSSMVAIIPLQLIAYYIAKEKNLDVDKPRNLAKSVTVE